jgi:hypothetical protein
VLSLESAAENQRDFIDKLNQEKLVLDETVARNKKAISQADQSKTKL